MAQAGRHQGLQKPGWGKVAAHVYTPNTPHPPPPPAHTRAPTLTTLKFKVVGSQQHHPECWPFPKDHLEGLAVISGKKKKFWST